MKKHIGERSKLVLLVGVAALAACGGGGGGGGGGGEASSSQPAVVAAQQLSASSCGAVAGTTTQEPGAITLLESSTVTTGTTGTSALAIAAQSAEAAYSVFRNFLDTAYSAITFNVGSSPRAIGPVPLAARPQSGVAAGSPVNWSSAGTWGGAVPTAGSNVVIPSGMTVLLDVTNTPSLGSITINGTLKFAPQNINLTAANILVNSSGALQIGTPCAPFAQKAVITLTGARTVNPVTTNRVIPDTRGITVNGGTLELYGAFTGPTWTQLNNHAAAGTTAFTLKENVNWPAGSTVAVGPSDYYGVNPTERLTLAATATSSTLSTTTPLGAFRWGKLQYMTDTGLSLVRPASYTVPKKDAPTVLDQRAAVANLSRNIVIQGANDADWATYGFGAHVMIMGLSSRVFVDGVELHRVGQAGALARYPFHWHTLSYSPTGQFLGNATGEIRNSSIWESAQRCVVLHATTGVKVFNNICNDIKGHAFFLEDGVERKNVFEGNLVLKVRMPAAGDLLIAHEGTAMEKGSSSGFWITNPDNIIRSNVVGDVIGNGYWNSFPTSGVGLSRAVVNPDLANTVWASAQMSPISMPHGVFDNNVAYSTGKPGINTDEMLQGGGPAGSPGANDLGMAKGDQYRPTFNGHFSLDLNEKFNPNNPSDPCTGNNASADCRTVHERATFSRSTIYKTNGGYGNRVGAPDYPEWIMSDIAGTYARGSGNDGVFMRGLFVGKSLNDLTAYPAGSAPQAMFATYHSTFQMRDSVFVNVGYQEDTDPERTSSGVFKTDDYYITMMERGTLLNTNNRLINAFAGSRHYPANLYSTPPATLSFTENFALSGAIWDPYGYWGNKGSYWTYDVPFLTSGGGCTPSLFPTGNGKNSAGKYNGQSCTGEFYGFGYGFRTDFLTAGINVKMWPIDVERLDCNPADFNATSIGRSSRACRWVVESGWDSWKLGNMRGATMRQGGKYKVMFPDPPNRAGYNQANYGNQPPVFTSGITKGSMVNAEGATVPTSIPKTVSLNFSNLARATDAFVVAISFDGNITPAAVFGRTDDAYRYRWLLPPNINVAAYSSDSLAKARVLTMASNLAEVEADPNGAKMWQDKPNNLLWVKITGNFPLSSWYRIQNYTVPLAQDLYQNVSLYVRDSTVASTNAP